MFQDVCSHAPELSERRNVTSDGVDKRLFSEADWKTLRMFRKCDLNSEDEISINSDFRFDATVAANVESFKFVFPRATPNYNEF